MLLGANAPDGRIWRYEYGGDGRFSSGDSNREALASW